MCHLWHNVSLVAQCVTCGTNKVGFDTRGVFKRKKIAFCWVYYMELFMLNNISSVGTRVSLNTRGIQAIFLTVSCMKSMTDGSKVKKRKYGKYSFARFQNQRGRFSIKMLCSPIFRMFTNFTNF